MFRTQLELIGGGYGHLGGKGAGTENDKTFQCDAHSPRGTLPVCITSEVGW